MVNTVAAATSGVFRSVVLSITGRRPVVQSWQWITSGVHASCWQSARAPRDRKAARALVEDQVGLAVEGSQEAEAAPAVQEAQHFD